MVAMRAHPGTSAVTGVRWSVRRSGTLFLGVAVVFWISVAAALDCFLFQSFMC